MKPYPKTKPSGVEWLGEVPVHWEVKRLRHVLCRNDGGVWGDEDDPEGTIVLRSTEQTVDGGWQIENPARRNLTLRERNSAMLKTGDLVVTKSSGSALHIGKTSLVNPEIAALEPCYSNFMQRLRVEQGVEPRLAFYVLNSPTGRQQLVFNSNTTTGLANLNGGVLGEVFITLPPPSEQTAIAAYLDRETGRIDELVGKKRELIERLKEKRTALISRTATRGLPADLPRATVAKLEQIAGEKLSLGSSLKPSGHPWVKDIPQHWKLERLKYVSTLFGRIGFRGYSTEDLVLEGDGAISMSPSNMVDGEIQLGRCTWLSWEKYHESPEIKIEENDVVMVKTGSTLGKVAFVKSVPHPMTINPQLMIFKEVTCSRRFLFYFLVSTVVQDVIPLHNTGSTIPTMTQEGIGKLPIPLPPFSEQRAIAAYLDEETAKLDALVAKVETAIERLQEYRTALITAAVTGKIDVREEVHA